MSQVGWSNESFAIALTYINWETDAIVGVELLQNVGIAIVCIFVTTLITLGRYIIMIRSMTYFSHWWLVLLAPCVSFFNLKSSWDSLKSGTKWKLKDRQSFWQP